MGTLSAAQRFVDLTTLEEVKSRLPQVGDAHDASLSSLISSVSRRMAAEMNRWTLLARRTETVRLRSFRRIVTLHGDPVQTVHNVRSGSTASEAASENPLIVNEDYVVEGDLGIVRMITTPAPLEQGNIGRPIFDGAYVLVDYTGGWGADAESVVAEYADVSNACAQQVAHDFQKSLGGLVGARSSRTQGGSAVEFEASPDGWLPVVRSIIQLYKREDFS